MKRIDDDNKRLFYDRYADDFDRVVNMYDTNKRIRLVFEEFLQDNLEGKRLLDAGCGTGWFSQRAAERGAKVHSLDVGVRLLGKVRNKCGSVLLAGDITQLCFKNNCFDIIISSEVIEHTVDPHRSVCELYRVLAHGGTLILTVPNKAWHFSVVLANALKLRTYEGYENWVGWFQLKRWMIDMGFHIEQMRGFHIIPFVVAKLQPLIDYGDKRFQVLTPFMLNIAIKAKKH